MTLVSFFSCSIQSCPSIVINSIQVNAKVNNFLQELNHNSITAFSTCMMQRCPSVVVSSIQVNASNQKKADNAYNSAFASIMERSHSTSILQVGMLMANDKKAMDNVPIASTACQMQGSGFIAIHW